MNHVRVASSVFVSVGLIVVAAAVNRGRTLASGTLASVTDGGARSLEDLFLELTGGETV